MKLRDVEYSDLPAVLALNEAAVPNVNRVSLADMETYVSRARYFRVAEDGGGAILGVLIAYTPEADYDSPNFLWFRDRYDGFVYIDRVIVAEENRGQGIGRAFYEDLIEFSRPLAARITCEVNSRPPNPGSLAFHAAFGFQPVGAQETESGSKEVTLMELSLKHQPPGGRS